MMGQVAETVERLSHVILEEKRFRQGITQRLQEKSVPFYTNNSRYGLRLPIGTEEVLLKVTPEQIRSFYKTWYRPDLQAILVVGDINVHQMEKKIKAKFSDLHNPEKEKERPVYRVSLTGKNQYMQFLDSEFTGISIEIIKKQLADTILTTADYRANLKNKLLAELVSIRFRRLPIVGFAPLSGGLTSFSVNLTTKPAETEQALKSVWLELRRMEEQGFTKGELERVKKAYQFQMDETLKEKDKTASEVLIKPYLQHFLTGNAAPGINKEAELTKELLSEVTLNEINSLVSSARTNMAAPGINKEAELTKELLSEVTLNEINEHVTQL